MLRRCGRCHEEKLHDAEHFVTVKGEPTGRCRVCDSAVGAAWRSANRDKSRATVRESSKRWREANPDKARAIVVKSASRPEAKAKQEAWRLANMDRVRAAGRRFRANHPVEMRANEAKRRAALMGAEGSHTAADIVQQFNRQKGLCYYCERVLTKFHEDHMTPLSRGGPDNPENIVCACPSCNLAKGARTVLEFAARIQSGLVPHIRKAG